MITIYHSTARAPKLETLPVAKAGSWIHVVEPSSGELDKLARDFNLERDILHDATDIYEAPRAEMENDATYVFARYCHPAGKDIATEPLLIVYTKDNIITIMRKSDAVLDQMLNGTIEVISTQKTKTFLRILEQINRSFRQQLTIESKRILQIRSRLRQSEISNFEFVSFIELEEDFNEFLTSLQPQAAVLASLRTGRYMRLYEEDQDLIEDLTLGTTELIEITKSRLRTLVNIRQAYDTIATNNLNRTFRRLTSIGIFLTIPMIAGGLWGMNVLLPFSENPNAFWFIVVGVSAVTISFYLYFKRKNWV